jgi:hypothetical protein
MAWSTEQRQELDQVIERILFGDFDSHLRTFELALLQARAAVIDHLEQWHDDELNEHYENEFTLTPEEIEAMSPEWKLAYLAQLLNIAVGLYGLGSNPLAAERGYPAAVLRAVNDIGCGLYCSPGHPEHTEDESGGAGNDVDR